MAYDSITEHTAAFSHPRPAGHRYAGIAIHWWGDPAQRPTFDGTIQYLVYGGARNSASVHYVAEAGRVACLLDPDTHLSWGQGDGAGGYGNNFFISIECNPRASDGDYATVAELIAELRAVYGPLVLKPHRDFTATACPGVWDLGRLDRLARGVASPAPAPAPVAPAPAPAPVNTTADPNRLHWTVEPGDTLGKIADYYGGPAVGAPSAADIARFNGIPDPNRISVGQVIYIPGPLAWTVDPGDTLTKIANYYGMTPEVIAANNGISVNATIHPGQVLRIID
jgi:N-acetylmuramoyl-L-alanine amidase